MTMAPASAGRPPWGTSRPRHFSIRISSAAQALLDQDQLCAGAVHTGQGLDVDVGDAAGLLAQKVDALGLVLFNADDAARDAGVLEHRLDAPHDGVGAGQHLLGVAGDPDFALRGVDQQGVHRALGLQLDVGGEPCAAQAHQAAGAHGGQEAGLVGHDGRLDGRVHRLLAVGLDDDRVAQLAVGQTERLDGRHLARHAGVDVGRHKAAGLTDQRANAHLVALFDRGFRRGADVLAHQDAHLLGQRHPDGLAGSGRFVMRRMCAKRRTFQLVQHELYNPPFCFLAAEAPLPAKGHSIPMAASC